MNIANQTPSQMIYGDKTLSFMPPLSNAPVPRTHPRKPQSQVVHFSFPNRSLGTRIRQSAGAAPQILAE